MQVIRICAKLFNSIEKRRAKEKDWNERDKKNRILVDGRDPFEMLIMKRNEPQMPIWRQIKT